MSVRRLFALVRGLGYTFQRAPVSATVEAGAPAVPGTVTSLRSWAQAVRNPKEFVRG